MRIAYLISEYPAPSHTFIRREVVALRAKGLDIRTYSVRPPHDAVLQTEQGAADAAETHYILPPRPLGLIAAHGWALVRNPLAYAKAFALSQRHRVPGARAFLWSLFHFAEAMALARTLKRDGVTHLHNHFANSAATVGLLASRYLDLPWSLTLHGISETDYPAGLLLADKIKAAQFVACVSWFGRAQAMRITPMTEWDKFRIVRCGIELDKVPQRTARGADNDTPVQIICVGRLSAEKGQAGLIDAFAAIRAKGLAAHLLLVGDGPEGDLLKARVETQGLADAVTFAGRLDEADTLQAIASSDILVLPSFMEGLPVVLMEAMAAGTPVIASRIAGVPELVEDGVTGLLFHPADWAGLAERLEVLIKNGHLREELATASKRRIADEFDIQQSVRPLTQAWGQAVISPIF